MVLAIKKYLFANWRQMFKYGCVGIIAAIVDFGVFFTLKNFFGWHYLLANTGSFVLSALVNYFLNRIWTFRSSGSKTRQLPVFFGVAVFGLCLNNAMLTLFYEAFHWHILLAKCMAIGIVMISNFLGNKYLTFKN